MLRVYSTVVVKLQLSFLFFCHNKSFIFCVYLKELPLSWLNAAFYLLVTAFHFFAAKRIIP